jgi:hypothetical protein
MTSYPAGLAAVPLVSNGNSTAAGQVRSTLTITPTGTGASAGAVSFFSSMATDVVVDVTGYFQAAPA